MLSLPVGYQKADMLDQSRSRAKVSADRICAASKEEERADPTRQLVDWYGWVDAIRSVCVQRPLVRDEKLEG